MFIVFTMNWSKVGMARQKGIFPHHWTQNVHCNPQPTILLQSAQFENEKDDDYHHIYFYKCEYGKKKVKREKLSTNGIKLCMLYCLFLPDIYCYWDTCSFDLEGFSQKDFKNSFANSDANVKISSQARYENSSLN